MREHVTWWQPCILKVNLVGPKEGRISRVLFVHFDRQIDSYSMRSMLVMLDAALPISCLRIYTAKQDDVWHQTEIIDS